MTLEAQGAGCEFCGVTLIEDSTITLDPGMYVSSADGACVTASNGVFIKECDVKAYAESKKT